MKGPTVLTTTFARSALAALGAALLAVVTISPANAMINNGNFDDGDAGGWWSYGFSSTSFDGGQFCGEVPGGTSNPWDLGFGQNDLTLPPGDYLFSFTASGNGPVRAIVGTNGEPYTVFAEINAAPGAGNSYELGFTMDEEVGNLQVAFQVGGSNNPWTFCVDDVSLSAPGVEFLSNTTFDTDTAPWWATGNVTSNELVDGVWCLGIPGGTTNPWDVIVGHNDLTLPAGDYVLSFEASGNGPVRAIVGLNGAPYTVYAEVNAVPGDMQQFQTGFSMSEEVGNLQVAFQVGGSANPWTLCLDSASLLGGTELPGYEPDTGPRVRVNQVGYLTEGPKFATVVTDATDPVTWELALAGGATQASGTTEPQGVDPSSGLNVHVVDFSAVTAPGTYTLAADGDVSYEFEIGTDAYQQMRYDALNYFYLARSGIEIEESIVGADYARPAGHVSQAGGTATNQGDYNVACQPVEESLVVYGEPWTCDYTLDVVGGWYDAGDHGKYVVNGGISTAQLLQTWERTKTAASAGGADLGDGTLNIPETGNGVPDVLDEARWQLEFMMSMMVPAGEDLEGMVHHKIHDYGWTGLPLLPHNSGQDRYLHRPSTAATLNLSATAAQGARLWAPYDAEFAAELLEAARITWAAALETPALYAPAADGANGGGPYNDDDVTDEFYWAAAQLYLTTGEQEFRNYILSSPVHTDDVFADGGAYWGYVAPLARMDLATVPNNLPGRDAVIQSVLDGADALVAIQQSQAFGQALPADGYDWGSNSIILGNLQVIATAYDLSGDQAYTDAVTESMDYLLGRNALNVSYITGYGDVYSENQHSRWFAAQLNPDLPHPPPGSVAGGPNDRTGTWDPTMQNLFADGCESQFCYVDNINSWASNEITVNWNSVMSWVASFMADQGDGATAPPAICEIEYIVHGSWPKGYNTQVWIKNTGTSTINGWSLTWSYPGDDTVTNQAWSARWSQEGATVTASSLPWNGSIKAGKRTTIGFIGDPGVLADAQPEQFWLNGKPCTTKG
ncbi:MAG: glycosyl hydrolase family 5 [Actinobacteria bacterium HGW-Actinobacteria-4]|nr:MAG: glycosyl hydrolase family 5 [Actinobacteria bacterium HGW-Actinobacteria-4]